MSYLNSKVTITVDVTDASPFVAEEAPTLDDIDAGVTSDLRNLVEGYFTAFGAYEVNIEKLDVEATHSLVEKAA